MGGEGPERSSAQALARRLGLTDRVRFLGTQNAIEEIAPLADVFLLPSELESFGLSALEAMACGVPVVGSDSGEIPHVIGDAGLIFPEGKPEELRARLARLLADPVEGQRLARLGRERVLQKFTQAQTAAATYEVYRALAQAPSPR